MLRGPVTRDAVLLLGSNKGRRVRRIREGVCELSRLFDIVRVSRLYAGEPRGRANQPWFLNAAVAGTTALPPLERLAFAKEIEAKAGRGAGPGWGPRELDVDIILMGDLVVREPQLVVPHAAMAERRFCLAPVAEVAPDAPVPPGKLTVLELLERCPDSHEVYPV